MAKRRLKIQTVCGVGMGSCVLIKMSIEKVAQEMGIPVEIEACDSSVAGGHDVDIIVTTQFLAASMGHLRNTHRILIIKDFVNLDHIRTVVGPSMKEFWEKRQ